ncbi:hypothetical protein HK102_013954 [Quaeritorhiza haematococci]|nr:hypothetical protein HK102_013954 [Quaeritorhiza haematococci]
MKTRFRESDSSTCTWRSWLVAFVIASLLLLGHNVNIVRAQIPPVSLNIGFVDGSPAQFVEMGYPATSANETKAAFKAIVQQVVAEAQAENIFPGYQLNVVYANIQSNTFQGMYQVARELIDQNVAMIVLPQRNVELREYFIRYAITGVSYMWAIDALRRLGFNRAVGIYQPSIFAQDVIETIIQSAPDMQIRTLQWRSQTTQEMISQILAGRETAIVAFQEPFTKLLSPLRQALGDERARYLTFISAPWEFPPTLLPTLFPNPGDENGVFDTTRGPFSFANSLYDVLAAREGWNATRLNQNFMRAVVSGIGSFIYAATKMWMYGFSELIKNATAADISTNYRSRPVINRPVYLNNFKRIGIDGYVQNFSQTAFFILQSYIRTLKLDANRTTATFSVLGTGSDRGLIANATFADGTSNRPPQILPYPTARIFQSQVYYAAYALGGISIACSIFLLLLLIGLRSRDAVKSASWVFLGTTLTGTMLLAVVLFPTATDPTYAGCNATPVLLSIAIHLILVSISVKAYRLNLIFANKLNKRIKLRDHRLAAILGLTYVPDLVILLVWLTSNPLEPVMVESGNVQSLRCVTRSEGFAWGLFGYGLAKLLVALRFTYLTRNVYSKYNETKSVLFAVYTVTVGIAIAIASFAVHDLGREGQVILLLIALSSASIGTSTAVAGYRILYALQKTDGVSTPSTGSARKSPLSLKFSPVNSAPMTTSANTARTGSGSDEPTPLKSFRASIREKRLWFAHWTSCCMNIPRGGPLIISFVGTEKGGRTRRFHGVKLDALRSVQSNKAESVSTPEAQYYGVEIEALTAEYEIVFETEAVASDFVKECEKLVIKTATA